MANDARPIGEKLRAMEERARHAMEENDHRESEIPSNRPENKEPAEGSRETVAGGGVSNRPAEERTRREKVPPRGDRKGGSRA